MDRGIDCGARLNGHCVGSVYSSGCYNMDSQWTIEREKSPVGVALCANVGGWVHKLGH